MIRRIHKESDGTYGMPRVHAELVEDGCQVGRKRVARLMRESDLVGVSRRRGTRTTRSERNHRAAPDRVERQFRADAPDRLWVADVTYVPTWNGFVYLAIVLDVFSRAAVSIRRLAPVSVRRAGPPAAGAFQPVSSSYLSRV